MGNAGRRLGRFRSAELNSLTTENLVSQSSDFSARVKGIIRKNFNESTDIYRAFEDRHRFFHTYTLKLADWAGLEKGSRILDIGCGNGVSCVALCDTYEAKVYGVDLSEAMIADGKQQVGKREIHFLVGDGEALDTLIAEKKFDAVMYNAAIFLFPRPREAFEQAARILKPGGIAAFSFYPRVLDTEGRDLIDLAYEKTGMTPPKFRTITSWKKAVSSLQDVFGAVRTTTWEMAGSVAFLADFFTIPAQSASLFPKLPYKERAQQITRLFAALKSLESEMKIAWDMAMARFENPV